MVIEYKRSKFYFDKNILFKLIIILWFIQKPWEIFMSIFLENKPTYINLFFKFKYKITFPIYKYLFFYD